MSDPAASASTAEPVPPSIPQTISPDALKAAFRRHAAGVAVITADIGDGPIAITVSSLASVSADPAVLLCSVADSTTTGRAMARSQTVVVHLLERSDLELAVRCATPGGDRFEDTSAWERLPSGEPMFSGPRMRLRGKVVQRNVFGDSTVLAIAVLDVIGHEGVTGEGGDAGSSDEVGPGALAYLDRAWHVLDERSRIS